MRLWAAFKENGFLFEALLPESDDEDLVWTVRISRGNEIHTHRLKLIWPPRFGPDAGDIEMLERFSEQQARALADRSDVTVSATESVQPPPGSDTWPADPLTGAQAYQLLERFDGVMGAWSMADDERRRFLRRNPDQPVRRLFAWAISADDRARLKQIVALQTRLQEQFPSDVDMAHWLRTPRSSEQGTKTPLDEIGDSDGLAHLLRQLEAS